MIMGIGGLGQTLGLLGLPHGVQMKTKMRRPHGVQMKTKIETASIGMRHWINGKWQAAIGVRQRKSQTALHSTTGLSGVGMKLLPMQKKQAISPKSGQMQRKQAKQAKQTTVGKMQRTQTDSRLTSIAERACTQWLQSRLSSMRHGPQSQKMATRPQVVEVVGLPSRAEMPLRV